MAMMPVSDGALLLHAVEHVLHVVVLLDALEQLSISGLGAPSKKGKRINPEQPFISNLFPITKDSGTQFFIYWVLVYLLG